MMNNKLFFISLLISSSVQSFGQDVVPRQAPIDKMSPVEGSLNKDKGDNPEFTKIPIIIDYKFRKLFKLCLMLTGVRAIQI